MNRVFGGMAFCLALAATGNSEEVNKLPIKRVVLYKNGVGYFEHLGHVKGQQDVTVSFTSAQLNDVLKSLTVLDLNGGRITGVAYGSSAPVDRQFGDLRLPVKEKGSMADFLDALRGARLEIHTGTTVVTGRLLSVERKYRVTSGTTIQVDYVSLTTDNGEVRTTELAPSFSIRLLERGLAGKVDKYLDLASLAREPDERKMVISTDGSGDRSLFVSYISEVPVWKTTYRIVLDSKAGKGPLLQGWAIVDNTVGEDWENVDLSLVAGAPQSFIQNLSQPYYSRRPVVGLPEAVSMSPQTFESTLMTDGRPVGDAAVATNSTTVTASLPMMQTEMSSASMVTRSNAGSGRALGSGAGLGSGASASDPMAKLTPGVGRGSGGGFGGGVYAIGGGIQAAHGQELGDLFEYKLKQPITIQKNRSALVPIVQSAITAEKVSVFNEQAGLPRPQRALWLTNSSGLTLDGGSFSVLEEETFAGEGVFDPIRPGEKRLVSYAIDLALNASTKYGTDAQRVTRVRVSRGLMTHESEIREKKTYTFRNEDSSPRLVIVEHPVRKGYELRGEAHPSETTATQMRFRLQVDPKQTAALVVEEARPVQSSYQISNITGEQVALFVQQRSIDKTIEEALRKILAQKAVVEDLNGKKNARDAEMSKIFDDQQRLRENLKSLANTAEEKSLVQRYMHQLNDQEDRLEALKKEIKELEGREEAAQETLDRMIQELAFDVKV
jgi:hypothetical protein